VDQRGFWDRSFDRAEPFKVVRVVEKESAFLLSKRTGLKVSTGNTHGSWKREGEHSLASSEAPQKVEQTQ